MDSSDREPVEVLAEEFLARKRQGQNPSLTEYAERFPHLADEIRDLFPALAMMEEVAPGTADLTDAMPRQQQPAEPPPEQIGDYRILREIGRGGMGVVYEAEQQSLARRVALKVLPRFAAKDAGAQKRFRREARSAARLHHTNIVPVFEVGQEGETCYYAMQFIQGQGLDEVFVELQRLRSRTAAPAATMPAEKEVVHAAAAEQLAHSLCTGRFATDDVQFSINPDSANPTAFPHAEGEVNADGSTAKNKLTQRVTDVSSSVRLPGQADLSSVDGQRRHYYLSVARIGLQVADALSYAHARGIVHRDIKPSNLLLDTVGVVWVTDFGLAKTDEDALTRTGDMLGTLRYMSPERFRGECDARADVYSLGITLYELLVLKSAFDSTDRLRLVDQISKHEPPAPRTLDVRVPRDLETIVLKSIAKDPRRRYDSAEAMAEDLRRFVSDEPILARRASPLERFARWARHNRGVAALTVAIAGLLLLATVVFGLAAFQFKRLASQEQNARRETTSVLYRSLVQQAAATRLARQEGYRKEVWSLLQRARQLDTPDVNPDELRHEAVGALGDFAGLTPLVLERFPTGVQAVAVDPQHRYAAIGLANGVISVRSLSDGREVVSLAGHQVPLRRLLWRNDGQTLVSADASGQLHHWRTEGDAAQWRVSRSTVIGGALLALQETTDGRLLAVQPADPLPGLFLRSLDGDEAVLAMAPDAAGRIAAISPDGRFWAAARFNYIQVREISTGLVNWTYPINLEPLISMVFSPDGRFLACACDQGFQVFNVIERRQQTSIRLDALQSIAFSPDGQFISFATLARRVVLWSLFGNREAAVLRHPGNRDIHVTLFSHDQAALVSANAQSVRVWNMHAAGERLVLRGHEGGVNSVAFSPDGRMLASASKDRQVKVWNAADGTLLGSLPRNAFVQGVAFSPDGSLLASADYSGHVVVVDPRTLEEVASLGPSEGGVITVGFSPDGRFLAATGTGMTLWSIQRESERQPPRLERVAQQSGLRSLYLRFSPDSRWLAWVDDYSRIRLWDVTAGQERPWQPSPQLRGWHNLGFHADSRRLFFVSSAGRVEAWDVLDNRMVATIGQAGEIDGSHVAISPNGNWLAVDFAPYSVGVWDTRRGRRLFVLPDERATINSLAFSHDDRRLAVGTKDGGLAIWDIVSMRRQLSTLDLDWDEGALAPETTAPLQSIPSPLEVLNDALAKDPRDAESYIRRARIYMRSNQGPRALADLDQALALQPQRAEGWIERGLLRQRRGSLAEAIDDFSRAIEIDPNDSRALLRGPFCAVSLDDSRKQPRTTRAAWSWTLPIIGTGTRGLPRCSRRLPSAIRSSAGGSWICTARRPILRWPSAPRKPC